MRHLTLENTHRGTFIFVVAALIAGFALVEFGASASSDAAAPVRVPQPQDLVTVRTVNSDNPWIKLQDARSLAATTYKDATGRAAWDENLNQSGDWSLKGAQPLVLASNDFDGNGFPDLVCGYATANGGVVSIRLGNPSSFAPQDPEILQGIGRHQFPDPFFGEVGYVQLLERPDFLGTLDFDRDGQMDIVAAARGSNAIYLLSGDGHGGFSAPQRIKLSG